MMKRLKITEGSVALVFKDGSYQRLLEAGKHWIGFSEEVQTYDLFKPFQAPIELALLLKNKELSDRLIIVEVSDNEIALRYEKNVLKSVLTTGVYAYWKGEVDHKFMSIDLTSTKRISNVDENTLQRAKILTYTRLFQVEPFEKGVLYIDGEFAEILGSGTYRYWKNATSMSMLKVDTRRLQLEVSGQEILTKDKAALRVNFHIHYQVADVKKALIENKAFESQLYILVQFALREFIGTLTLDELLEKKDEVGVYVLKHFDAKTKALGVELKSAGIRDVILPGEIKEIMNQVLVAQKKAQANIITRREETSSTRSLLNTAKLMEDNAMLFKLKEMEYVEKIAGKIGEITVSGGGNAVEQLKEIFSPSKT